MAECGGGDCHFTRLLEVVHRERGREVSGAPAAGCGLCQHLQRGDGNAALLKLEEIFRQCGRLEATPHYLIYEAALQVLEAECPNPEYRPNVVLAIHDRTVPSLSVLARQYCYERTNRSLHGLASSLDLQYEAVPYAITARDWRDGFECKAGAAVPEIADAIGGVEGGQLDKWLRTAQLKWSASKERAKVENSRISGLLMFWKLLARLVKSRRSFRGAKFRPSHSCSSDPRKRLSARFHPPESTRRF
jgi:hypothetical protein